MKKILQVADTFRLKQGNLVIIGSYVLENYKTKTDITSQVGSVIKVVNPSGQEITIKVISKDVSISLIGQINLAIELPSEIDEKDVPIGSTVFS